MKKNNKYVVTLLAVLFATGITQNAEPLDWKIGLGGSGIVLGVITSVYCYSMKQDVEHALRKSNIDPEEREQLRDDLDWYKIYMYGGLALTTASIVLTTYGLCKLDENTRIDYELIKSMEQSLHARISEENNIVIINFNDGKKKRIHLRDIDRVRMTFRIGTIAMGGIDNVLRKSPYKFSIEAQKSLKKISGYGDLTKTEKILLCVIEAKMNEMIFKI